MINDLTFGLLIFLVVLWPGLTREWSRAGATAVLFLANSAVALHVGVSFVFARRPSRWWWHKPLSFVISLASARGDRAAAGVLAIGRRTRRNAAAVMAVGRRHQLLDRDRLDGTGIRRRAAGLFLGRGHGIRLSRGRSLSTISKTSGQMSAHSPQPVQMSGSTIAFMLLLFGWPGSERLLRVCVPFARASRQHFLCAEQLPQDFGSLLAPFHEIQEQRPVLRVQRSDDILHDVEFSPALLRNQASAGKQLFPSVRRAASSVLRRRGTLESRPSRSSPDLRLRRIHRARASGPPTGRSRAFLRSPATAALYGCLHDKSYVPAEPDRGRKSRVPCSNHSVPMLPRALRGPSLLQTPANSQAPPP